MGIITIMPDNIIEMQHHYYDTYEYIILLFVGHCLATKVLIIHLYPTSAVCGYTECIILYSTYRGVLYPHCCNSITSVVSYL